MPRNAGRVLSLAGYFHPLDPLAGERIPSSLRSSCNSVRKWPVSAVVIYRCCRRYVRLLNGLFIAFSQSDSRDCARLPTLLTHMKNVDELRSKLNETQSNTRNRINVTKRLIERSFLQLRESHRLLYAADR